MLTTKIIMQISSMGSSGIKGSMQFAITDNKEVEKKGAKTSKNRTRAIVVTMIRDTEFFLHQEELQKIQPDSTAVSRR